MFPLIDKKYINIELLMIDEFILETFHFNIFGSNSVPFI